jgi:hypothetical protein
MPQIGLEVAFVGGSNPDHQYGGKQGCLVFIYAYAP